MRLPAALLVAIPAALAASTALAEGSRLAPLPKEQAAVVHAPYDQGACDTCHRKADPKDPGPAVATRETCLGCHDEFGGAVPVKVGGGKSHPVKGECTGCHNPHNSAKRKLLR